MPWKLNKLQKHLRTRDLTGKAELVTMASMDLKWCVYEKVCVRKVCMKKMCM